MSEALFSLAERLREIAGGIVDTRTEEGKDDLLAAADLMDRWNAALQRLAQYHSISEPCDVASCFHCQTAKTARAALRG